METLRPSGAGGFSYVVVYSRAVLCDSLVFCLENDP